MKKNIHIKWMHCISCEIILEKELKNISWVDMIMVNHKKWLMQIDYEKESDYKKVVKAIEKNNFKVVEENSSQSNQDKTTKLLWNIIAILIVILLFIFSKFFDINRFIPDTSSVNYLSSLLIWFIASLSTCLAITWWIIIGFSKYLDKEKSFLWHFKVQTWFQVWRVLWFFLFWGILWLLWEVISINYTISGLLTIFVWIILIYMWLNILWIIPSITKIGLHMPKSFVSKIEKLWKPKFSPIVWALTFFLPCWFTQTMQILAVSTWSFIWGWLVMMFFALWTIPVLYSLWLGSSYFTGKKFDLVNKIIAAIVIFFGIFSISNSYKLININSLFSNTEISNNLNDASNWVDTNAELKEINISHNWWSTDPMTTELKAGWNYKIIITPTSNGLWCMSTQVIPKLSNKVSYVKKWESIVYEIYNAKKGTYDIVCASMWMEQWRIIIK